MCNNLDVTQKNTFYSESQWHLQTAYLFSKEIRIQIVHHSNDLFSVKSCYAYVVNIRMEIKSVSVQILQTVVLII